MKFSLHLPLPAAVAALALWAGAPAQAYELSLEPIGTYAAGAYNLGAAEIPAYDPFTRRAFIVNGAVDGIDVLDLHDPAHPTKLATLDVSSYGSPNSVAVDNGLVAVAVEDGLDKTLPGWVVFFNAQGTWLNAVQVGALPDMITFSPNGRWVLVANEGEPSDDYLSDPEGSVSCIPIPPGILPSRIRRLNQAQVRTAGFQSFVASALDPSIRIFGPGASVAQDMEPEYIAVSPDSRKAWVTCQENNAIAVLDLNTCTITELHGLGFKDHSLVHASLETFTFPELPEIGTTAGGDTLRLGGISGLSFEGQDPTTGHWRFLGHTDRGPNAEPIAGRRPFALPDFQPQWVRFELDPATGVISEIETIGLTDPDGAPLTGLPNTPGTPPAVQGKAYVDEIPVDVFGQAASPLDRLGGDFEGVVRAPDGTYWMSDEYRPSIYHFDATGRMIQRYVPAGTQAATGVNAGVEALPAVFAQRRANRGFEGVAWQNGRVYAFIQSPLDNPDLANDGSSKASRLLRIVEFDPATETTTGQYLYTLEVRGGKTVSDKLGDALALPTVGEFLVMERDDDVTGVPGVIVDKKIFRISLSAATNLEKLSAAQIAQLGSIETNTVEQLLTAKVQPVRKDLFIDLDKVGYNFLDKCEGLAFIDANTLAVVNDNDFGLNGVLDTTTGKLGFKANPATVLGIIHFDTQGLDASDSDGKINIRPWPVFGMFQPDSIATFSSCGRNYLITANEGDSRGYPGFSEEIRVAKANLDPTVFPDAAELKLNPYLGRLTVSTTGDLDGDGDLDRLYAFGARSFSIWTEAGALVYDSGELLEQLTASVDPLHFNASNDNNKFDDRSDNKGPEPEGLAVGSILGRPYAFVGMERSGGIAVFDLRQPEAPRFVDFVNRRDFTKATDTAEAGDLGPEGLKFIPAWQSPNGRPLLLVANEISGTTTIYQISSRSTAD